MGIVSHLFKYYDQAQRAVSDLEAAGVPPSSIKIKIRHHLSKASAFDSQAFAASAGLGAAIGGAIAALSRLAGLHAPLPNFAGVDMLHATAFGLALGAAAGGVVWIVAAIGAELREAAHRNDKERGTLVLVTVSESESPRVRYIMRRHIARRG